MSALWAIKKKALTKKGHRGVDQFTSASISISGRDWQKRFIGVRSWIALSFFLLGDAGTSVMGLKFSKKSRRKSGMSVSPVFALRVGWLGGVRRFIVDFSLE